MTSDQRIPLWKTILLIVLALTGYPLLLYMAWMFTTFVHEAGHVVVGLLCGFRLKKVRVGPIELTFPLKWAWRYQSNTLAGGITQMCVAKWPTRWIGLRYFLFVLAGPGANLLFVLILIPYAHSGSVRTAVLILLVILSSFMALLNLIPKPTFATRLDGNKLFALVFLKSRRKELLFWMSLHARVEEAIALCKAGNFPEARTELDEILMIGAEIPKFLSNTAYKRFLEDLHERLVKHIAALEAWKQQGNVIPTTSIPDLSPVE